MWPMQLVKLKYSFVTRPKKIISKLHTKLHDISVSLLWVL